MSMIECPVCGYNPSPQEVHLSDNELKHKRLLNIFSKNLQNSWWLTQPEFVCHWLKTLGVNPKNILDIGCGDGRWLPAISKHFPDADYTGIDRIQEHIEINKENFPDHKWIHQDVSKFDGDFDTVFLMGTANPQLSEQDQSNLFGWLSRNKPRVIIHLFDYNASGTPIEYKSMKINTLKIPKDECGPKQDLIVWVFQNEK